MKWHSQGKHGQFASMLGILSKGAVAGVLHSPIDSGLGTDA